MAGSIEGDGTADWMFGLGSGCLEGDAAAMIHVISVKNLIGPIPTTRGTFVELSDALRGSGCVPSALKPRGGAKGWGGSKESRIT